MGLLDTATKGWGGGVLIGIGAALVAPVVLPAAGAVARPLAKGLIWGFLAAADKLKEVVAETREQAPADSMHHLSMAWPTELGSLEFAPVHAGNGEGDGARALAAMDRRVVDFFGAINAGVGRVTSGLDLKLLVPVALFFLGMR